MTAGTDPPQAPEACAIADDLPCRRCGYNLRGLAPDGVCPECATPVALSARGDLLRHADPQWVETVLRGLQVTVVAGGFAVALFFVGRCVLGRGFVHSLADFCVELATVVGAWLITAPDPVTPADDLLVKARRVARVGLCAGAVGNLLVLFTQHSALPPRLLLPLALLATGVALADAVGEFAKLYYLQRLALRIPSDTLFRRGRQVRWAYPTVHGLVTVAAGLFVALGTRLGGFRPGLIPLLLAIIGGFVWLAMCATFVMWLRFHYDVLVAVNVQATLARQAWAVPDTSVTHTTD